MFKQLENIGNDTFRLRINPNVLPIGLIGKKNGLYEITLIPGKRTLNTTESIVVANRLSELQHENDE